MEEGGIKVFLIEYYCNIVLDNYLFVGGVDVVMYNYILNKCFVNMIGMEELIYVCFVMIKLDFRWIIEVMKFDVWCLNMKINRSLNIVFNSVRNGGGRGLVFFLFVGYKFVNFCGLVEMLMFVDLI